MIASKGWRGKRVVVWGSAVAILGITAAGALVKLREELSVWADARAARGLVAGHQFEQAREPLARWIKARPGSAEAWFLTARERFAANAFDEGFQALERARSLGYSIQDIERQKAIVLARLGRLNEAEPVLRRLLLASSRPDPEADEALAKCYLETFQLGQAETVINRWIDDAPATVKPFLCKLELARKVRAGEAFQIEILERIVELDPGSDRARLDLAEIHLHSHRLDDAARGYTKILELHPDNPAAHHGLGVVAMERGDEAAAMRHLDHAIKLDPRDPRLLMDRAKLEVSHGRLESGLSFLDMAMSLDASEPEVHYQRSLILNRMGRIASARLELETSTRLREERKHIQKLLDKMLTAPGDLDHQYEAARWLFEHAHPEEGLRWAEKILRDQPRHARTNRLLADYYEKQGNHGLANFYQLQAAPEP